MPRNEIRTKNFEEIRVIDINRPMILLKEVCTSGVYKRCKPTLSSTNDLSSDSYIRSRVYGTASVRENVVSHSKNVKSHVFWIAKKR